MSTAATPPYPVPSVQSPARSLGMKFFLVIGLALLLSLSGFFVDGLTSERAERQGIHDQGSAAAAQDTAPTTVAGVRLVDSYRSTERSLHYIPLFLGLVFLTYFLFEVLTQRSLHPAQYAMVGVAQIIFYLLLLSLAEHLGFDLSFFLAGGCTVGLFTLNTKWVFRSRRMAAWAFVTFTALYLFIYVLLRVEAYALLIGAFASFAAIGAAMFLTRNVDWYGMDRGVGTPARESWLR